ncbi:MAG: glycoside hydrolase family 2, partial [Verrucomicrobia bacterium]|nr:glycoside hydrolase family 2 [Verrucomicrobiota bacterium]
MKHLLHPLGFLLVSGCLSLWGTDASWRPAQGPLQTRWAKDVSPANAHPEYPRPQLVRKEWQNLNGLWDFAITTREAAPPTRFDGQILVPFPVESALSGVRRTVTEKDRLWYHRAFMVPRRWSGQRVWLHFGAVDFETVVFVNGSRFATHRGGYDPFTFDITEALNRRGTNELVVAVWDPTDGGQQPRGKQVRKPDQGIFYTATSGIWQTVWLEPVPAAHIQSVNTTPDIDRGTVTVAPVVTGANPARTVTVTILDDRKRVYTASGNAGMRFTLPVKDPKLWSPEHPFLYGLEVTLNEAGKRVDSVASYFGMRKVALGKDARGVTRIFLNNQPYFMLGPLDQGFWPDGLYTAPTDAALRYDLEATKKMGFNMCRKHVKVEPERWYYWCDKLGVLVWQDMPSGDRFIGGKDPDIARAPESAHEFETELKAVIEARHNHPSIVMWVLFNEGWGQYDTSRLTHWIKELDPTRLVDDASGWADRGVGDVRDMHRYPGPGSPKPEPDRAAVLGEFGGLGYKVDGHTWAGRTWGYRGMASVEVLRRQYARLLRGVYALREDPGLSAAVYTQTTDVEYEGNGLMTY